MYEMLSPYAMYVIYDLCEIQMFAGNQNEYWQISAASGNLSSDITANLQKHEMFTKILHERLNICICLPQGYSNLGPS